MLDGMADTNTDADAPLTEASLARLELSAHARGLADTAADLVAVDGPVSAETVQVAGRVQALAGVVREQAVIAARAAGVSWAEIGTGLGITRQEAHRRWRPAEAVWTDVAAGVPTAPVPVVADDPDGHARDLDAWADRHCAADQHGPGRRPVTDGLDRMGVLAEASWLIRRRRALLDGPDQPPDPGELAAVYEREAVLNERMAAGSSQAAYHREAAAHARGRAAELRAQDAAATEGD